MTNPDKEPDGDVWGQGTNTNRLRQHALGQPRVRDAMVLCAKRKALLQNRMAVWMQAMPPPSRTERKETAMAAATCDWLATRQRETNPGAGGDDLAATFQIQEEELNGK